MTNAAITIQNLTSQNLSLDIKIDEDRVIRDSLAPIGAVGGGDSIEVGDKASLDELNKNAQVQALLANPAKIRITTAAGTTDIAGSDAATAAANSEGLGGLEVGVFRSLDTDGTDHELVASMPFAANIIDVCVLVDTTEATTWTLRDAAAGGGNALSDDLSTSVAGRVRDASSDLAGVMATIALGDPLYLNKAAAATATGTVIVLFQRL